MGRGPLDHLPDIEETVPEASASSPMLPGGGGGATPGSAIAHLGAKADTPKERALGKCAVRLVGSTAAVERVVVGVTQLPPQRTKGAPGSIEDRLAPMDMEACFVLSQKQPAEVPTLAPLKVLKVNPGSTALQRGTASVRANPKEPATQGGATEAALTQMGEGAPLRREGEARESDGAEVPSVAKATVVKAPRVSEAKAMEAGAPRTAEAAAAGVGALMTTEATMVEAGAPGTTEANVITVRPLAPEVEMKAAEASVAPLVQGPPSLRESAQEVEVHPISSDDTSRV
ncbi:uncharacterized protein [Miscanthus floridulus]|uniref:uncharacterized protein n=1 Tax=Miscanthus floridulus TaxID=154761 RepID=UPI003457F329